MLEHGPFITQPNLKGESAVIEGVIIELFTSDMNPDDYSPGTSPYAATSGRSGRALMFVMPTGVDGPVRTRVTYPTGSFNTERPAFQMQVHSELSLP